MHLSFLSLSIDQVVSDAVVNLLSCFNSSVALDGLWLQSKLN